MHTTIGALRRVRLSHLGVAIAKRSVAFLAASILARAVSVGGGAVAASARGTAHKQTGAREVRARLSPGQRAQRETDCRAVRSQPARPGGTGPSPPEGHGLAVNEDTYRHVTPAVGGATDWVGALGFPRS